MEIKCPYSIQDMTRVDTISDNMKCSWALLKVPPGPPTIWCSRVVVVPKKTGSIECVPCPTPHTIFPGGRYIYHRMGQVQVPPRSTRVPCSRGCIHQSLRWHCCRCPMEGQNSGWYGYLGLRCWMGIFAYSALHQLLCPQQHFLQPHQVPPHQDHCGLCWVDVDPYRNTVLQPDALCHRRFSRAHRHHWGSILAPLHQPGRLQCCGGPSDATLQRTDGCCLILAGSNFTLLAESCYTPIKGKALVVT